MYVLLYIRPNRTYVWQAELTFIHYFWYQKYFISDIRNKWQYFVLCCFASVCLSMVCMFFADVAGQRSGSGHGWLGVANWLLIVLAKSSQGTIRLISIDSWNWEPCTEENEGSVLAVFCVHGADRSRSYNARRRLCASVHDSAAQKKMKVRLAEIELAKWFHRTVYYWWFRLTLFQVPKNKRGRFLISTPNWLAPATVEYPQISQRSTDAGENSIEWPTSSDIRNRIWVRHDKGPPAHTYPKHIQ
jgi:hypothetical protein